jgi:V8-like Glu-specific endopeptidase
MHLRSLLIFLLAAATSLVFADEGMWTFNSFPAEKVQSKYGWAPTQKWLDDVRLASVRIAGGCSASVVSRNGLVMTNHHCAHSCIKQLSSAKHDFVKAGFFARESKDELKCPEIEINQLVEITDVTAAVQGATEGVAEANFNEVQRAKIADIEKACAASDDLRCDVVSLYRGGHFDLYKYRRFQDVRLVFAPEFKIAFFGGDPDNFVFPRYDLDVSFLRIYDKDGKAAKMVNYLPFSMEQAKEGDLSFVSGNPGGTSRLLTVAQLETLRDVQLPMSLARLSELRGLLTEYGNRGPEQARQSSHELFGIENGLKARKGRHAALADVKFFASKVAAEADFKAKVAANAELAKQYGDVWDAIGAITMKQRVYQGDFDALERGMNSEEFSLARALVRAAEEFAKPNGQRLREYADARLPQLKQHLFSTAPIHDEFETTALTFELTKVREQLGADHPAVKAIFGNRSPQEIAHEAVKGSRLKDVKFRKALFADGKGKQAIAASKDPMIALARLIDVPARALREKWEHEVDGPLKKQGERLAKAYFAIYGNSNYPDATFTLRLSYGSIKGYMEHGAEVKPITTISGAFDRATGRDPFALPARWLAAKGKLALDTPMNFASTNDIIGGNSGSPVVNKAGEIIGLIFDGNTQSLGGDYGYDESANRAIAVHSAALIEALDKVYGAKRVVAELRRQPAARPPAGIENAASVGAPAK